MQTPDFKIFNSEISDLDFQSIDFKRSFTMVYSQLTPESSRVYKDPKISDRTKEILRECGHVAPRGGTPSAEEASSQRIPYTVFLLIDAPRVYYFVPPKRARQLESARLLEGTRQLEEIR